MGFLCSQVDPSEATQDHQEEGKGTTCFSFGSANKYTVGVVPTRGGVRTWHLGFGVQTNTTLRPRG